MDEHPEVVARAAGRLGGGRPWLVLRALGGALLRVGRALPDYLWIDTARRGNGGPDADTGEWPAPDVEPEA